MINLNYKNVQDKAENFEVPLQGHKIEAGESKKRIDIEGFKIAGRVIKESGNSFSDGLVRFFGKIMGKYVEVKGQNGEILLLNISSLSKRILLNKETIKENAELGKLENQIDSKVKELKIIISNYNKQRNNFFGQNPSTKVHPDLTPELLIKVIEAAFESKNGVIRFNIGDKWAQNKKLRRQKYFVHVDQDKNIIIKRQIKVLGEGTLGKAKYLEIDGGTKVVFKQAKSKFEDMPDKDLPKYRERAIVDVQKEAEILSYIHSEGKCIGIEDKPISVVKIKAAVYEPDISDEKVQLKKVKSEEDEKIQIGIMKTKFDGDYKGQLQKKLSIKTALLHSLQLLAGGKFLADKDILQGDIKPANIFVKGRVVQIADFGGACRANEESDLNRIYRNGGSRAYTRRYLNIKDARIGNQLVQKRDKEELVQLEKKADAFSLGIILYEAFSSGTYPFGKTENGSPDPKSYIGFAADSKVPKEVQEIINKLLIDDYKDRSSCEEAFFPLLKYVQENYPEIAAEFNEMMKGCVDITPSPEYVAAESKRAQAKLG